MGLGKTVMALAEVMEKHDRDGATLGTMTVLIITTKSAISVWESHIEWMFPDVRPGKLDVKFGRQTGDLLCLESSLGIRFLVTNWDQLRVNHKLKWQYWTFVIADEAHHGKNRNAKRTKAWKHIKGKFRRALTGTPIINRPDELWSILNWLFPQEFTSYWRFYERFVNYTKNPHVGYKIVLGPKNIPELRAILKPICLRRLKKDVLKELPDKYYTTILVDMTPSQKRIYQEMKKEALAWVGKHENEPVPAPVAVAKLTRLRQFAASYANIENVVVDDIPTIKVRMAEPSSKLDAMMEMIEDNPDKQFVVFSQFKQLVLMASARLKKKGITHVGIIGDTPPDRRKRNIERFQRGEARVFLATTQSGGVGITLTAASTCIFLDRSWSPAINAQAEDRLHRIGQKDSVQVVSIQSRGTVDQVVEERLQWKWKMIRSILEGKDPDTE